MEESKPAGIPLPLDHPDIAENFGSVLNILLSESDRGAVLVGACVVDNFLRKLFEHIFPDCINKDTRRGLLKYPGPLSSTAAKADVALATRLIDKNLHKAIHALRNLRNSVAHSPDGFSLDNHENAARCPASEKESILLLNTPCRRFSWKTQLPIYSTPIQREGLRTGYSNLVKTLSRRLDNICLVIQAP